MITAIVNILCTQNSIPETAQAIADHPAVNEVYSVTGTVDLIAIVRVTEFDHLADVITDGISKLPGVSDTETHVAFRTYSRHDLDAAFSIGLPSTAD